MITRETKIVVRSWTVQFTVHDNVNWTVSLSSDELEVGATSDFCQPNWDKGLAEAFCSVADMVGDIEGILLLNALDSSKGIDSTFTKYLPPDWQQCLTRQYEEAYDAWENTWIDGPHP